MARRHPEVHELAQDGEMNRFLDEFQTESDRAAAVLGAALLDDLMSELLSRSLLNSEIAKKLLGINQSLGAFGARITAARAMGLISNDEHKDLDRVREIRNKFAHRLHGLDFETQQIRDMCGHFHCVTGALERGLFQGDWLSHPRLSFNLAVGLLATGLQKRIDNASRPKACGPIF
jgi:hypothetical protein